MGVEELKPVVEQNLSSEKGRALPEIELF